MSYYRGDYLRGDYYRGDPGILGAIGSVIGKVAKTAISLTPAGRIASTAISLGSSLLGSRASTGGSNLPVPIPPPQLPSFPGTGVGVTTATGPVTRGNVTVGVSPLGTVGIRVRKRRRMNVANVRALRRALRRAHGFAHLANGVMSYTITGKHKKFSHFKAKRRSR